MVFCVAIFVGDAGTGKSALAAYLALQSEFPFVKVVQASSFIGLNELQKAVVLGKVLLALNFRCLMMPPSLR